MRSPLHCRWFGVAAELEIRPHSTLKRFTKTTKNQRISIQTPATRQPQYTEHLNRSDGSRINEMNVQMLSRSLHRQIFPQIESNLTSDAGFGEVKALRDELMRHRLDVRRSALQPDVDLTLPRLRGLNIEDHFWLIAKDQSDPYRQQIETLPLKTPAPPTKWSPAAGWTQYNVENGFSKTVPFPDEPALIFDVEVCVRAGLAPVMATAFGTTGSWYSWTSTSLSAKATSSSLNKSHDETNDTRYQLSDMIPLESDPVADARSRLSKKENWKPRIVIGHNVSYDRARVREQYWLEPTALRFLDTMSLHICVSGVTSYQRVMLKSKKLRLGETKNGQNWSEHVSLNNLADVYALYCDKDQLEGKSRRNTFVDGTLDEVAADFNNLMSYCADDVRATRAVLARLWPLFCKRFPHPATLAGMLEMGSAYMPVNGNWTRYLTEADLAYEDLNLESKHLLSQRANAACNLLHDASYRRDLWLWDQDWSVQQLKLKVSTSVKSKKNSKKLTNISHGAEKNKQMEGEVSKHGVEENKLAKKFAYLYEMSALLPARRPLLPGYPAWYRQLCSRTTMNSDDSQTNICWNPGASAKVGTGMQIAPKLLSLCWEGYPLHYIRGHGWGFLVPYRNEFHPSVFDEQENTEPQVPLQELAASCPVVVVRKQIATRNESSEALQHLRYTVEKAIDRKEYYTKGRSTRGQHLPSETDVQQRHYYAGSGIWCGVELADCCYFLQLPHKDGPEHRVGNPLSKDFLAKFSENVLAGDGRAAERIVEIARMLSYWRNNRDRIRGQLVVWDSTVKKKGSADGVEYGAILPQVVVCGTLTRRAMEPTWMTASNALRERIGSELRAMVQAPEGYRIVGADVDSQELWIASMLGDAGVATETTLTSKTHLHGVTPFGWMTLSGTKATRTDMHSVTAAAIGISRDHAKVINYARIYGAGRQFAEQLLKQFNPTLTDAEARSKAIKMFALTKGRRMLKLRKQFREEFPNLPHLSTAYEALRLARASNRAVSELFHPPRWIGGTESAMFNRLEEIAGCDAPRTPFLGGRLSRALDPPPGSEGSDDRFLPTRINWVVQSGAVDFLHLMLVCMRWLMGTDTRSRLRFCLSFHDEVRYLVPERYAHHAALSMHVTNLLTRCFCAHRVGFRDLPQSVAFFSSVEIDRVLRKEAQNDCRTPSNPHGLRVGYGVPDGESLDIYQTMARLGPEQCNMSRWDWHQSVDTDTENHTAAPKREQLTIPR